MSVDQPDVLASHHVAQAVAESVMGGTATPGEVAIVREAAADSFEAHIDGGTSRKEATRLVNEEMLRLLLQGRTPEEIHKLQVEAMRMAAERERTHIEERQRILSELQRTQAESFPTVQTQHMTANNPE